MLSKKDLLLQFVSTRLVWQISADHLFDNENDIIYLSIYKCNLEMWFWWPIYMTVCSVIRLTD